MSKSSFKTEVIPYVVKGSGETQEEAVEETFKHLRETIGEQFKKPVISIRTIDYNINNMNKTERSEAFLFVFMKRTRTKYDIEATIKVEIDFVEIKGGK